MDEPVKLCKDCKHLLPGDKCANSPMPIDYVHGGQTGYYSAQAERQTENGCGKNARRFEPKEAA